MKTYFTLNYRPYWVATMILLLCLCTKLSAQVQIGSNFDGSYKIAASLTGGITQGGFGGMLTVDYKLNNYDFLQGNIQANFFDIDGDSEISVPVQLYAFNIGFFYDILRNNDRTFAIAIGGGVSLGYEAIDAEGSSGVDFTLGVEDTFVYGGYVGFDVDVFLIPTLAINVKANEFYHINSEIGAFSPYVGLGVKLILF